MHVGQHWPAGVIFVCPAEHTGLAHNIAEQSGLQNGSLNVIHALSVHLTFPFSSQLHSLHPSLNEPVGHVSQPTKIIYCNNNQIYLHYN